MPGTVSELRMVQAGGGGFVTFICCYGFAIFQGYYFSFS